MEEIQTGDYVRVESFMQDTEYCQGGEGKVIAKTNSELKIRFDFFTKWWVPKEVCKKIYY